MTYCKTAGDVEQRLPLLSVVIPAYNAAATLDATLASVCSQTYRNLEAIVVDDGSTDNTAAIAARWARFDDRIRTISVPNGGVGAARNCGVRESRGAFIAPLDADDIWSPLKLARHMETLGAAAPDVGFTYSFSRRIDPDDLVWGNKGYAGIDGNVYLLSLAFNYVGNGSAVLIRREAFNMVGGYAEDRQIMGSEDFLIQCLIARHWKVVAVPLFLCGYRATQGSLSANPQRILRSRLTALDVVADTYPETPLDVLRAARAVALTRLSYFNGRRARFGDAAAGMVKSISLNPSASVEVIGSYGASAARFLMRRQHNVTSPAASARPRFQDVDPTAPLGGLQKLPLPKLASRLKARELDFRADLTPVAHPPATGIVG
jgi:glycosyltransferase involved in cell wall biosynthesis